MNLSRDKMVKIVACIFLFTQCISWSSCFRELCNTSGEASTSCSNQIFGSNANDTDNCRIIYYPTNSSQCHKMEFDKIVENADIGEVKLVPYFHDYRNEHFYNITVFNVSFSNINWKTLKFRFERNGSFCTFKNHCRNIVISPKSLVKEHSVMYYDCVWSRQDDSFVGENYIFDYEAHGDAGVKRGQFYFAIPHARTLSPNVSLRDWQPFVYIEIGYNSLKLHILPAPSHLHVDTYKIEVIKVCEGCPLKNDTLVQKTKIERSLGSIVYEHTLLQQWGQYYFLVTPLHKDCPKTLCTPVKSPTVIIKNAEQVTVICIASISSLFVAILFTYYIVIRYLRKKYCRDPKWQTEADINPSPPKILVIYSPVNKLHTECVKSFVSYLRTECGLHVMHDDDISATPHADPYVWSQTAFAQANYLMVIVSPDEKTQENAEEQTLNVHRNLDTLQLKMLKDLRAQRNDKHVLNVVFDHCRGKIPIETHNDYTFYVLKDWQRLIAFLTRNMIPKQQLARSEKGRCFLEDLKRAKKHLNTTYTFNNVLVTSEKPKANGFAKKVLL